MEKTEIIRAAGRTLQPDQKTVFALLECAENNPCYAEKSREYKRLLPRVQERLHPAAALTEDIIPVPAGALAPGTKVLYAIATLGKEITDYIDFYLKRGEVSKGLMLDAIADASLFAFEEQILVKIREYCTVNRLGVAHQYEAPQDIPMELQKAAFERTSAAKTLGLSITDGFMFEPVKSLCQVFELTEDTSVFQASHDCSRCDRKNCPLRHNSGCRITVQEQQMNSRQSSQQSSRQFQLQPGQTLLQGLQAQKIYVNAVCGGTGRCGKCRIRVLQGQIPITEHDRRHFLDNELENGMRLACLAVPVSDCTIALGESEETAFQAVGMARDHGRILEDQAVGIAIDIGTTTLALSLVSLSAAAADMAVDTVTSVNHQRSFGADVVSRILSSGSGKAEAMRDSIRRDLLSGIRTLLQRNGVREEQLQKIAIAGNTTMLHLLMGYSCDGLGKYPFRPVTLALEEKSFAEVFGVPGQVRVFLLPGISAFVGADIVSGIYCCDLFRGREINALIDLGTNGEMAVGNCERMMVSSTAAGPAFEGGNIKWGVGSIAGAISRVRLEKPSVSDRAQPDRIPSVNLTTIGDQPPVGICGTGVIETVAELVRTGLVEENGTLQEPYFAAGFPLATGSRGETIVFTQKDVREIQLAKAAIRAGFETLLLRYGVTGDRIAHLYLSGGFGFFLDVSCAVRIGMLPRALQERTTAAGNTSLEGAVRFLTQPQAGEEMSRIARQSAEVELSMDPDFGDLYMKYMQFEDD